MIRDIIERNEQKGPNDKELEVLSKYFSNCFDKEGIFNIDKFKQVLQNKVDFKSEGYGLNFLGKSYAKLVSSLETTTLIKPNMEHNSKEENKNSENVYISGDNLDALKHLLNSYAEGIDFIFIDPPYNTGNDGFVYNDNFNFTVEELGAKLNLEEEEAQKILDLTSKSSSSNSAWLTFMYSRLLLARDLLSKDGVIFISIDDNQQANLKLLCDEVFGEENFVSTLIWQKAHTRKNSAINFSSSHDYILCYAKKKRYKKGDVGWTRNLLGRDDTSSYSNPDNDPRGVWKTDPIYANNPYEADYIITKPNGTVLKRPTGKYWRYSEETIKEAIASNKIVWGEGDSYPYMKRFLADVQDGLVPVTLFDDEFAGNLEDSLEELEEIFFNDKTILTRDIVGDNLIANNELKELFGLDKVFSYPKPTKLIGKLIEIGTKRDSIVLDFFSGSGTTAHSVFKANMKDDGQRKFIAVQLPEEIESDNKNNKHIVKFLEDLNHPLTLDYLGFERLIRARDQLKTDQCNYDFGFKHYELIDVPKNTLHSMQTFDPNVLFAEDNILKSIGVETVLQTWLVQDGYGFNASYKTLDLGDYKTYLCDKHLYLISPNFTKDLAIKLVDKIGQDENLNPTTVILFGYSFVDWLSVETLKANLKQLSHYEKNLNIEVISRY